MNKPLPATSIKRRRVLMSSAFVAVAILIWLLWPAPKENPAPLLPSPNGYDDFLKAGQMVAGWFGDYARMSKEELRFLISTNQEPLRLVRLGLGRDCQVPTEDSMAYIQRHLNDLSSIKRVAQLLSAEGRLAEAEGRHGGAAEIYVEIVRLGQTSAKGGLIIDKLVGVAVENIGLTGLERVFFHLNMESSRSITSTLEKIDTEAQSAAVYIKRDRQFGRKATDAGILSAWIQSAWMAKSFFPHLQSEKKFKVRLSATDRRRRQFLLNLASQAYELEHGKRPLRAEDLVPSVLRAVPKDPERGTNLVLSPRP
jgi:hypothetical protein